MDRVVVSLLSLWILLAVGGAMYQRFGGLGVLWYVAMLNAGLLVVFACRRENGGKA